VTALKLEKKASMKHLSWLLMGFGKGTLPNYFLKISVIMTLSLGPPLPLS